MAGGVLGGGRKSWATPLAVAAVGLLLPTVALVAAPQAASADAASDAFFGSWSLHLEARVTSDHFPQASAHRVGEQTAIYDSDPGEPPVLDEDLKWSGGQHTVETQTFINSVGEECTTTVTTNGAGEGSGRWVLGGGDPALFDLSPEESQTAVRPIADGSYPNTQTIERDCGGASGESDVGDNAPVPNGVIFLPATLPELAAMPVGTVLTGEYSTSKGQYSFGAFTLGFRAVKGLETDTDGDGVPDGSDYCPTDYGSAEIWGCAPFTLKAGYAITGLLTALMRGGDRAELTREFPGTSLSWVGDVCITQTWSVTVQNPLTTAPVLWNGAPAEGLTYVTGNGIDRTLPIRYVGRIPIPIFRDGRYIETVTQESCGRGTFFAAPIIRSITTLSGRIVEISHSSTATVKRSDGAPIGSVSVPGSSVSVRGPFARIGWLEEAERTFG